MLNLIIFIVGLFLGFILSKIINIELKKGVKLPKIEGFK